MSARYFAVLVETATPNNPIGHVIIILIHQDLAYHRQLGQVTDLDILPMHFSRVSHDFLGQTRPSILGRDRCP